MPNSTTAGRPTKTTSKRSPKDFAPKPAPVVALLESHDEETAESGNFVIALARGLSVMRAFTSQSQHLTLSDVSRIVDLPRATVRRCLLTLQTLGYVESKDRYFSLSPSVLTIAQAYLTSSALPRVSQSFLERLSEQIGESCSISILHGQEVIYVARSARKRMASLHREVGTQLPAHCTSMGRVLLAALSESELERFFAKATLTRFTPATITSPAKLTTVLKRVSKEGYCIVDEELEGNLRAIAVPVRNAAGAIVGAMNVSTQASQTSRARMVEVFLPPMLQAAAELRPLLVS
ncbi:IclR family transcriptional regulator C-terminal domain-containing protein [Caulobacter sp. S45]|uniref:IclR family transcriptional regulator domain-containing protein n=1 Tax=Caulobacter sp. S45 TaxID=1641861 RepID=UPI00131C93EC|nr:IclR family transcriptional regulator C-terminal domain-containing protein [Caulobacter sp. S45]